MSNLGGFSDTVLVLCSGVVDGDDMGSNGEDIALGGLEDGSLGFVVCSFMCFFILLGSAVWKLQSWHLLIVTVIRPAFLVGLVIGLLVLDSEE